MYLFLSIAKPNAGMPVIDDGRNAVYSIFKAMIVTHKPYLLY